MNGQRIAGWGSAVKRRVGPLWYYSGLIFAFMKFGDAINLLVGAFLVPALISAEDLGAIIPFRMILALAAVPMTVVSGVALKFVNAFHVGESRGQVKALMRDMARIALTLTLLALVVMWLGHEAIRVRLKLDDGRLLWVLAATVIVSQWIPIVRTAAQGLMRFRHMILVHVVQPAAFLVLILLLLKPAELLGYLVAMFGAGVAVLIHQGWAVREYLSPTIRPHPYSAHRERMRAYALNVGSVTLLMGLAAVVEPWVIRHFTPRMDSAGYYMAFMFGQIPLYVSGAFVPFLFPLVSAQFEKGEATAHMLRQTVGAMTLVGLPLVIAFAAGGRWLLELRPAWALYADYAPYLWRIGLASTLQGMILAFVQHENACCRFGYIKGFAVVLIAEIVLLYVLMGWHVFQPWLPASVWGGVERLIGNRLTFAVWMMLAARVAMAIVSGWQMWRGHGAVADPVSVRMSRTSGSAT